MSIKRVLAFSAIRSDYDLLSGLYRKMLANPSFHLGLIVSGAHLSETYGYTVRHIEADGIPIVSRIESLFDANSRSARIKSLGVLLQCCLQAIESFAPDLLIYAGDREDIMAGALAGAYLGIPTAHFFGGDHASDGNVDNPVRHAVSKLSSVHFVSLPSHRDRLISMGERSERIYVVGNPAVDKLFSEPVVDKMMTASLLGKPEWDRFSLMIQHPIFGDEVGSGLAFEETLKVLKKRNIRAFVSYPNTDAGSKSIIDVIQRYAKDDQFHFFKNLDRNLFINLMRHATFLIGNSSAGLLEAPHIPLGAINVGRRQRGRLNPPSVLFCEQDPQAIDFAIDEVLSAKFQEALRKSSEQEDRKSRVDQCLSLLESIDFAKFRFKPEDPLAGLALENS